MKLKYFLLKNLNLVGGIVIGFALPICQFGIISKDNPNADFIFLPIGIILLIISYYYTFIKKY